MASFNICATEVVLVDLKGDDKDIGQDCMADEYDKFRHNTGSKCEFEAGRWKQRNMCHFEYQRKLTSMN